MKTLVCTSLVLALISISTSNGAAAQEHSSAKQQLNWQAWSNQVFADAKREHRFVLLDLEAVWCHWCHVMDANTYSNPAVIKLLRSHYIVVKADQDSRPDLSTRYEDFGWPATIVFDAAGHEIVKRQGYLAPDEMASMLQAIIDDPSPGPSVQAAAKLTIPANAILAAGVRTKLTQNYLAGYDPKIRKLGDRSKIFGLGFGGVFDGVGAA
jgi:thioredoxin-related protein